MRIVLPLLALALGSCYQVFHEFDVAQPSNVAVMPPPPTNAVGVSHAPYAGIPKYLAEARPLYPTRRPPDAGAEETCEKLTRSCEDRLRAVLATIDGQILALSTPPTDLQLDTLRTAVAQLGPLLVPLPDLAAERDELCSYVAKLETIKDLDQPAARKRMTELTDLIRVQLAAAR